MPKKVQRIKKSEEKIKKVREKLQEKIDNPKDLTLREFIFSLKEQISDVIDAGYDYSDIANIIKAQDIKVSESTIRSYLNTKKDNFTINSKKKNHHYTEEETSMSDDSTTNKDVASEKTAIGDVTDEETVMSDDDDKA